MEVQVVVGDGEALAALEVVVEWADDLYLCYAWAASKGGTAPHWTSLQLEKVKKAVIGVHFAQTEPATLWALAELEVLRVVADARGVFHPKLLLGIRGEEAQALLGSSNLTAGGFPSAGGNVEINVVLKGTIGEVEMVRLIEFVEGIWDGPHVFTPSDDWLDAYEDAYGSRPPGPSVPPPEGGGADPELADLEVEWGAYVALIERQELRALANGWEIRVFDFPEEGSYLEEAEACAAAFAAHARFEDMPESMRRLVAGWGEETSGYFGRNTGAGFFKQTVLASPEDIGEWLDLLPLQGEINDDDAKAVLEGLLSIQGVALGVATRLMCVKRPDRFVVINNANDEAVRRIFGSRPRAASTYMGLMQRIWSMPWWSAPCPTDPREARIWRARVALLDAVMYEIPAYQR